MIMVLSCFNFAGVITNQPATLLYLIFWLREDYDLLIKIKTYVHFVTVFLAFSFHVLLVISFERYLGAYYPIFHRTSVTKRRLLTLLAILLTVNTVFHVISANDMIISRAFSIVIFVICLFPPLLYFNFKLFKSSREVRQRNVISPKKGMTMNLKSISTCWLVLACLLILSIPSGVYIVFNINTANREASNARLSYIWATAIFSMNCTFNSLIFFWKNKVLRTEGIKILKTVKDKLIRS